MQNRSLHAVFWVFNEAAWLHYKLAWERARTRPIDAAAVAAEVFTCEQNTADDEIDAGSQLPALVWDSLTSRRGN